MQKYGREQPYYAKYKDRLPRLRFGMPSNQFRFSAALLDVRIPTANPISAQIAFDECECDMALLGYTQSVTGQYKSDEDSLYFARGMGPT